MHRYTELLQFSAHQTHLEALHTLRIPVRSASCSVPNQIWHSNLPNKTRPGQPFSCPSGITLAKRLKTHGTDGMHVLLSWLPLLRSNSSARMVRDLTHSFQQQVNLTYPSVCRTPHSKSYPYSLRMRLAAQRCMPQPFEETAETFDGTYSTATPNCPLHDANQAHNFLATPLTDLELRSYSHVEVRIMPEGWWGRRNGLQQQADCWCHCGSCPQGPPMWRHHGRWYSQAIPAQCQCHLGHFHLPHS
jgi:hypothetical protein